MTKFVFLKVKKTATDDLPVRTKISASTDDRTSAVFLIFRKSFGMDFGTPKISDFRPLERLKINFAFKSIFPLKRSLQVIEKLNSTIIHSSRMKEKEIPNGFTECEPDSYHRIYLVCNKVYKGIDGRWRKCSRRFRKSEIPEKHKHKYTILIEPDEPTIPRIEINAEEIEFNSQFIVQLAKSTAEYSFFATTNNI